MKGRDIVLVGSNDEMGGSGGFRQSASSVLRDKANRHKRKAEALLALARLIDRRYEGIEEGSEDPEPVFWELFLDLR